MQTLGNVSQEMTQRHVVQFSTTVYNEQEKRKNKCCKMLSAQKEVRKATASSMSKGRGRLRAPHLHTH